MAKEKNKGCNSGPDWQKYIWDINQNVRDMNDKISHIISQLREADKLMSILDDFRFGGSSKYLEKNGNEYDNGN